MTAVAGLPEALKEDLQARVAERGLTVTPRSSSFSSLLTPTSKMGAPEKDEYLALLGALGALVRLAPAPPEQIES